MNVESESEGIGGASPGRFRTAALVAILAGGTGSVGLTFYSGQSTDERLLVVLIAIWVLSPFAVLLLAHRFSARWSNSMRRTLHGVATVVGFGSVALYAADAAGPGGHLLWAGQCGFCDLPCLSTDVSSL